MARRPTSRASRGAVAAAATAVPESSAPSAHTPVGTNDDPTALVDYSVGGTLNIYPSLAASATCFGAFQGSLGVDGMTDQFYFLGASSQGTMSNPMFFAGGVARSGILEGLVPVNTELYLRAGLLTQVHCQSDASMSCGTEALFGGTLSTPAFRRTPSTSSGG